MTADVLLNVELDKEAATLDEVTVSADRISRSPVAVGSDVSRITVSEIRRMPALLGEPDALRSLHTLPGVQVSHHGSVNMSVRGGSYSQNLVLLDEAPVFNPSHILGFVSSFNPDAFSTVDLYKGVPARYGSKLSSIVDIRMKEGSREQSGVSGSVGFYNRKNVFSLFTEQMPVSATEINLNATKMYLYGILPMISYEFKF